MTRERPGIAGGPTVEELSSELKNSPKKLAFIGFAAKAVFRFFIVLISFLIVALGYFSFEHADFRPVTEIMRKRPREVTRRRSQKALLR